MADQDFRIYPIQTPQAIGVNMRARELHSREPVQFTGSDFRRLPVDCPVCSWQGAAGQLQSVPEAEDAARVDYHCPECASLLATHAGLSNHELLKELERIKQALRDEFLDLRIKQQLQLIDLDRKQPDFSQVRQRFYLG